MVEWQVEGMTCNNCAAGLKKFLEKNGMEDVVVNFQTKEVRFARRKSEISIELIKSGIQKMGYSIIGGEMATSWFTLERKLVISAIFTFPLLMQHITMSLGVDTGILENVWFQLVLCLPVFLIGIWHFGGSAWSSLQNRYLNMDVLIFVGSTAAFIYSIIGTYLQEANYIFYETSATIITLVLLGNWLEKRAVQQTTTAIGELSRLQVKKAKRIMPSGQLVAFDIGEIRVGQCLQVNEGDYIPLDGRIIKGKVKVDESMVSGESEPIIKEVGDQLIGGALLLEGNCELEVEAIGKDTLLGRMIELVKNAQEEKPDIQRLADKISAIFVPAVLIIALLTFVVSYFFFAVPFQNALMNSIAVLVISCPCAMGLATPTAVMVGVGRLAKNGILVKGGQSLEIFAKIKNFVFDKTGTLTTGVFNLDKINFYTADKERVLGVIYALEKHSSHPIAKSLTLAISKQLNGYAFPDLSVNEKKGIGLIGLDTQGNQYKIGSSRILANPDLAIAPQNQIYLTKNDQLLATINLTDTLKKEAKDVISYLKSNALNPVILSGDRLDKTKKVAKALDIEEYYGEQLPEEKLQRIEQLSKTAYTAMVGDGINDAPALAKATLGVSLSNASQVAIQSAQIILLNGDLNRLKTAIGISRHTVLTIKQNLFWAFAYNIVAIPVAAFGFLNPMWGALFMAFSDVVVIGNSIRLKTKKIEEN